MIEETCSWESVVGNYIEMIAVTFWHEDVNDNRCSRDTGEVFQQRPSTGCRALVSRNKDTVSIGSVQVAVIVDG